MNSLKEGIVNKDSGSILSRDFFPKLVYKLPVQNYYKN